MRSTRSAHAIASAAWCALSFVISLLTATTAVQAVQDVRYYAVGNSLTGLIRFDQFQQMVQSRGNSLTAGVHVRGGATLDFLYQNPNDPETITFPPFGAWPNALPNYTWDAVSIQPFSQVLEGPTGDLARSQAFIDVTRGHSPNARMFLYQTWPSEDNNGNLNYHDNWLQTYDGQDDTTVQSRDFFTRLATQLRADNPSSSNPILMIPAGEVLFELNERMHAGQVPGFTDVTQLYADQIHLNMTGSYILALTAYSTIFRDDPHGLSGDLYGVTDPLLKSALQDTVWDVVRTHPFSGVPEPGAVALLGSAALIAIVRRRRKTMPLN